MNTPAPIEALDSFDNMAKELAKWLEGSEDEAADVLLYIRAKKLHDDDPEDYRPDWLVSDHCSELDAAIRDALEAKRCSPEDVVRMVAGLVELFGDPQEGDKGSKVRHHCVPYLLTSYEMADLTEWLACYFLPSIVDKDVIDPRDKGFNYFPLVWTIDGYARYAETEVEADFRPLHAFVNVCRLTYSMDRAILRSSTGQYGNPKGRRQWATL